MVQNQKFLDSSSVRVKVADESQFQKPEPAQKNCFHRSFSAPCPFSLRFVFLLAPTPGVMKKGNLKKGKHLPRACGEASPQSSDSSHSSGLVLSFKLANRGASQPTAWERYVLWLVKA